MPRGQKAACLQKLPAQLAHFAGEGMNIAALEQGQPMNIVDLFKPLRVSLRVSAGLLILRLVAGLAFISHG
jgi:hypothetical protein